MKKFNAFYITVAITGLSLFYVFRPGFHNELSYYGLAESRATEINYNYPVVVDKILVKPGQAVKAGEVLLHISRRKSKETLAAQGYQIAELKAEGKYWRQRIENEIQELKISHRTKLSAIERKITSTQNELDYKKSLMDNLKSIQPSTATYKPLEQSLINYKQEKAEEIEHFNSKIEGLNKELAVGQNPYEEQIKRYNAEFEFDESQKNIPIEVRAPTDGLVGNISCKEEEHIQSYSTLLTLYEPHSGIIVGYIHEDLILEVMIGQEYNISSLKDSQKSYPGKVIGLGSRIVEIPSRLRKVESIKAYGREVLVEISKDNTFLQNEKVSIIQNTHNALKS